MKYFIIILFITFFTGVILFIPIANYDRYFLTSVSSFKFSQEVFLGRQAKVYSAEKVDRTYNLEQEC